MNTIKMSLNTRKSLTVSIGCRGLTMFICKDQYCDMMPESQNRQPFLGNAW